MADWGVQFRKKDGPKHLIRSFFTCLPVLFNTKREAREWIEANYAYIRNRKDLQNPPHNWRMPRAVRVSVEVAE